MNKAWNSLPLWSSNFYCNSDLWKRPLPQEKLGPARFLLFSSHLSLLSTSKSDQFSTHLELDFSILSRLRLCFASIDPRPTIDLTLAYSPIHSHLQTSVPIWSIQSIQSILKALHTWFSYSHSVTLWVSHERMKYLSAYPKKKGQSGPAAFSLFPLFIGIAWLSILNTRSSLIDPKRYGCLLLSSSFWAHFPLEERERADSDST